MSRREFEKKISHFQKHGFVISTEEYTSSNENTEEGEISDSAESSSSAESADRTIEPSFSDKDFEDDDRKFEVNQALNQNKLPKTASKEEKKRRADWARNLDGTKAKIDKFDKAQKKVRRELQKRKRKLARTLGQLGSLTARKHFPGNGLSLCKIYQFFRRYNAK